MRGDAECRDACPHTAGRPRARGTSPACVLPQPRHAFTTRPGMRQILRWRHGGISFVYQIGGDLHGAFALGRPPSRPTEGRRRRCAYPRFTPSRGSFFSGRFIHLRRMTKALFTLQRKVQGERAVARKTWIPAFAGMTALALVRHSREACPREGGERESTGRLPHASSPQVQLEPQREVTQFPRHHLLTPCNQS